MDLASRWLALWPDNSAVAVTVWRELVTLYGGNGRYYHTLNHVANVLRVVDNLRASVVTAPAVELAAWFHDAVYDPLRNDNEEQSARLAAQMLPALGVPSPTITQVMSLIRLTTHRDTAVAGPDAQVLLDADLSILAAPRQQYATYARQIRREYGHVDEAAYRNGRARVLYHFLQREPLFFTQPMQQKTHLAHNNMRHELSVLQNHESW